jgi:hypothetical protein
MTRYLLASISAVVLIGLLGACGGEERQMVQQSVLAASRGQGQGAVIYRGSDQWYVWISWNDYVVPGDTALYAIHSSDPEFGIHYFCEGVYPTPGDGWTFIDYLAIWNAAHRETYWTRGSMPTRVYRTTVPAAYSDAFTCSLLKGESGVLLAEGTSKWFWNDINTCNVGPGRNAFYLRSVGSLSAPSCPRGVAQFDMGFHYLLANDAVLDENCQLQDPADLLAVVVRGPDLTCIGK